MKTIHFNADCCIRCGKCSKVCPSEVIEWKNGEVPSATNEENCIDCGHCAAICPANAVNHSNFPPSAIHPVDYSQYPTPEQLMLLIKARRSNRQFSSKEIPTEQLTQIIEAARRAPTAENSLSVKFSLITDPEKIKTIARFTLNTFEKLANILAHPLIKPWLKPFIKEAYEQEPALRHMISEFEQGNDLVIRGATAMLIIYTPQSSRFGCEDANLAYQNASLMAEALGIAHFYTGFVLAANKYSRGETLEKRLGINGKIYAAMALGMPQFRYPNYIDRDFKKE